ncbi:hypothetical protein CPZ30_22045 [Paenibacillus lautus]|nr:hypothetical protein CPZ30_22045 [Paenibacillus lautus]
MSGSLPHWMFFLIMLILDTVMHSRQVHNPLRYGNTSNLARIKQLGIAWSQIKKADGTNVIQIRLKFFFVFEFFTKAGVQGMKTFRICCFFHKRNIT